MHKEIDTRGTETSPLRQTLSAPNAWTGYRKSRVSAPVQPLFEYLQSALANHGLSLLEQFSINRHVFRFAIRDHKLRLPRSGRISLRRISENETEVIYKGDIYGASRLNHLLTLCSIGVGIFISAGISVAVAEAVSAPLGVITGLALFTTWSFLLWKQTESTAFQREVEICVEDSLIAATSSTRHPGPLGVPETPQLLER